MNGSKIKVLVTGGLGNLGSWITDHLAAQPAYEVTVLANKDRELMISHPFNRLFCDLTDAEALKSCLANRSFDHIIHLASVNDTFAENYPELSLRVNAGGTRNLLMAVSAMPLKKFIYLSTFHIYGKEEGLIKETDAPCPLNDYSITHYFAELYIRMVGSRTGIPWIIFRLSNSYGCPKDRNSNKWYLLFNDLCRQAMEQKKIVLKTNGRLLRDFIAMEDVCNAVQLMMEKENLCKETFNLGSGKAITLLDVAREIGAAYNEEFGVQLPVQVNEADTNNYPISLSFNTDKLKQVISFAPKSRFREEARKIFSMLG